MTARSTHLACAAQPELGALIGYYIMTGMTLLAHEVALPPGMAPSLAGK